MSTGNKRRIKSKEEGGKKKKMLLMGSIAIVAVAAAAVLIVLLWSGSGTSKGYSKPEKAIEEYTKAIAAGDFEKALSTFDSEERGAAIDLEKYIDRMQAFIPDTMPAPEDGTYPSLNKAETAGTAAKEIKLFTYSLQKTKNEDENYAKGTVSVGEGYTPEEITKALNPENLKGLTLERTDLSDKATQSSDRYKSNSKDVCKIYGCKEIKEYTALYKLGDRYYRGGVTLAKYENGWKIQSLSSPLAEMTLDSEESPIAGIAVETTKKEYKEAVSAK